MPEDYQASMLINKTIVMEAFVVISNNLYGNN